MGTRGLAVVVAMLVWAAPAQAVQRYAAVGGTGSAPCTSSTNPCLLATAVGAAQDSDEVIVAPGTYALSAPVQISNFTLRGTDPAQAPVLDASLLPTDAGSRAVALSGFHPSLANVAILGTAGTYGLYEDVGGDVSNVTVVGNSARECVFEGDGDGSPGLIQNVTCETGTGSMAAWLNTLPGWGSLSVRNCTFVNRSGGPVAVQFDGHVNSGTAGPPITITNSIVYAGAPGVGPIFTPNTSVIASHNWMFDQDSHVQSDGTNIYLQSPSLEFRSEGVRENPDSVTVDKGSAAGASPNGIDYEGDFRSFGSAPDIGADEVAGTPAATASPASGIAATSATLNGIVTTGGKPSTYHFDYGLTTAYGSSTPTRSLPGSNGGTPVSASVSGLPAQSTIHFRLVITTRDGTLTSHDLSFSDVIPPPGGGGGGPGPTAPKLAHVLVTKHIIQFTLSRAATLNMRIQRVLTGHRKGRTCSTRIRHGKRCTTLVTVSSRRFQAKTGTGRVTFPKLKKGAYRVTLTPTGGKPVTLTLRIK